MPGCLWRQPSGGPVLGSCRLPGPWVWTSTMTARKLLDYYSCLPGHDGQPADAEQAYIQRQYTGTPTWLLLPEEIWPEHWNTGVNTPLLPS